MLHNAFFGNWTHTARTPLTRALLRLERTICLYRDVWIAAIASSTTSLATRTAAICVRFQGRRVRRGYVTMQITFLTRKSALIYRRGLRQRVASLTIDCNGVFAIRAYEFVVSLEGGREGRGGGGGRGGEGRPLSHFGDIFF